MKNPEYNSHAILLIIKECTQKSKVNLDPSGISKTYEDIKEFAAEREGLSVGADDYLYKIYRLALNASEKRVDIGMKYSNLLTICQYVGYKSYKYFLEKNSIDINEAETSVHREITTRKIEILQRGNHNNENEWLDKYVLGARIIPALFGLIPLVLTLSILVFQSTDITNTAIILVAILFITLGYGLSGWLSTMGKQTEAKFFHSHSKRGFPTSYLMLFSYKSEYSTEVKQKYRDEITAFFGIEFPAQEEEKKNEKSTLQKLHEATFKIKNNVKTKIIRSSNIRYGKIRNSIPSSLMGLSLSLAGLVTGVFVSDLLAIIVLSISFVFYLLTYLYLKTYKSLESASRLYAKYLIEEFLSRV